MLNLKTFYVKFKGISAAKEGISAAKEDIFILVSKVGRLNLLKS